jgi:hypothetical protein
MRDKGLSSESEVLVKRSIAIEQGHPGCETAGGLPSAQKQQNNTM